MMLTFYKCSKNARTARKIVQGYKMTLKSVKKKIIKMSLVTSSKTEKAMKHQQKEIPKNGNLVYTVDENFFKWVKFGACG